MRAVRGWVTSSEPVSLKQATRIISTFAARDNQASQAVTSYLKRAAASFNDLLLLHRDLRRSGRPACPRPEEPHTRAFRESRRRERKRDGSDGKAAAGGRDKVGIFIKDDEENSDNSVRKGQKSMSEVDVVVAENAVFAVEGGTERDGVDGGEEGGRKAKRKNRGDEDELTKKKKKKKKKKKERSEEEKA